MAVHHVCRHRHTRSYRFIVAQLKIRPNHQCVYTYRNSQRRGVRNCESFYH